MLNKKTVFKTILVCLLAFVFLGNLALKGIRKSQTEYVPAEYEKFTGSNKIDTVCEATVIALIPLGEEKSGGAVLGYYYLAVLEDMSIGAVYMNWHTNLHSDITKWVINTQADITANKAKDGFVVRGVVIPMPRFQTNLMGYLNAEGIDMDAFRADNDIANKQLDSISLLDINNTYPDTVPVPPDIPVLPVYAEGILIILLIVSALSLLLEILFAKNRRAVNPTAEAATAAAVERSSPNAGWQCSCGRTHPPYVSNCVCGKNKRDQ